MLRINIGKAGFNLPAGPFLAQHNRTALIMGYDVGRVLADIDANHGDCSVSGLGRGVWAA